MESPQSNTISRFFILPVLLFLAGSALFRNYVVDDAYIHMTFVRNLANTGEFSFNVGTPVYGTTSPLWVMVNAAVAKLLPFFSVFGIVKTLSFGFSLTSLLLFILLCKRQFTPPLAFLLSFLFASNPWFIRWSLSGMEVGFVLTLVLTILLMLTTLKGPKLGFGTGFFAGLLMLTRPEFVLFLGVLIFHLALLKDQTLKQKSLIIFSCLSAFLIIVLPWSIYAELVFGSVKPNTVLAKSVGYYLIPNQLWVRRIVLIVMTGHPVELCLLAIAAFTALRGTVARAEWFPFFRSTFILWAWPCGLFAGYLVTHSPVSSRYALMGTPVAALFVGHLISLTNATLLENGFRKFKPMVLLSFAGVTSSLILLLFVIYPQTQNYQSAMQTYSKLVSKFQQIAKPGDQIAAGDVGILGYQNNGDYVVVDLHGLVTTSAIPMRRFLYDVNFYLRDHRVEWLMESAPAPNHLAQSEKLTMIQQDLWLLRPYVEFVDSAYLGPYGVAESQDQYYSLYRINWDRYDLDHPEIPNSSTQNHETITAE